MRLMLFVNSWITLFLNSTVLLAHSTSVLFFGQRNRLEAMAVNSDVFENDILGFLFFTDGFSTLEILSVTLVYLMEKALRALRFPTESNRKNYVEGKLFN